MNWDCFKFLSSSCHSHHEVINAAEWCVSLLYCHFYTFTNRSPDSRSGFLSSTKPGFSDLIKILENNFLGSVRSFHSLLEKLIPLLFVFMKSLELAILLDLFRTQQSNGFSIYQCIFDCQLFTLIFNKSLINVIFFHCAQEYIQLRSETKSQYYHNLLLIKVKKTIIYYFHSINSMMVFFWFWFGLDLVFCLGKNVKTVVSKSFYKYF